MTPAESNATTGGRRPGIPRGTRLLLVGLAFGSSSAINSGLNRPNLITVVARGSSIDLYVMNPRIECGGLQRDDESRCKPGT